MIFWQFCFLVFIIFFNSCTALKKRPNAPTVTKEVNLKLSFDQALSKGDFEEGDWPDWNWWVQFGDSQLNAFMDQTIQDNPNLKAAISRVYASQQEARKTGSVLFPQLNTSFLDNYGHLSKNDLYRYPPSKIPAVINQINLHLNFEYEIDLFKKNRETYSAAIGEARSQKAEMSQAYLMITTSLAQAYFDYQANKLRINTQKELIETQNIIVELTHQRVLNNLENEIPLEEVRANFLQIKEGLVTLEKNLALSKSQIKILMGISPDDELIFALPQAEYNCSFPLPENLPINLLVRRPDLMMQIWKVEAMAHLVGAARAAFFPNINLASFVGFDTLNCSKLFSLEGFAGFITPAVNLPLFTGWRLKAGLEQSFANFDTAVFDYNALILKAAKEVSDGLQILQASNREVIFQKDRVMHLTKVIDLTYARFQYGISNYLEVMQAKLELLNQVIKEIDIQYRRHLAVVNLIKALGGGYNQEKVEVNTQ